ncbi:Ank3 [Symbiodinium necroappetens]|uniref:Ank3 protein n=1 Tax=Symbiodinium necroappetens TaxID=1628268 RepID=A0A812QSB6_9DINO|nr:Ank3 [Symbiodinium necroappetens]
MTGPRTNLGAWKREAKGLEAPGVTFGDRFLELGQWRLWAEGQRLILSHQAGTSVKVYQSDGSSAGRRCCNASGSPGALAATAFARPASKMGGVAFGDRFLQIGHFRLGDVDGAHFAISHPDGLSEVHHSDGTLLPSGTSSLTTLGRRLEECQPL